MTQSLKTFLKQALQGDLPGAVAHRRMLPSGRRLPTETDWLSAKMSSVLLLIFPADGRLFLCLTKRPATMKHHPGQVSFPGGKVEKDDLSAESAALREAHEEVGIDPESVEIIGKLSDLFVEVSGFSIQPFVAWIDQQPHFQINRTEVEKLIILPISDLVAQEEILEKSLVMASGEIFIKYYPFGNEIIWGATAMIMAELIDILRQA